MFNEKNKIWIKIFKYVVVATSCILAFAALVCGFSDMNAGGIVDADIVGDDGLGDLLVWIIIFGVPAALNLSVGMLMVNFFTNVQDIREKICGEEE